MQAFEGWAGTELQCIGRRIMEKAITYVGLDVHKDSIVASLAESRLRGDLREVRGRILNTPAAVGILPSARVTWSISTILGLSLSASS